MLAVDAFQFISEKVRENDTYRGNNIVEEQTEYFDGDYSVASTTPL